MAAISAFLIPNNKNYPVHYFEACISTYLNTCRFSFIILKFEVYDYFLS